MNYFMLPFETFVAFGWIFRVGLHSSLIDDYLVLIASLLRQNLAIRTLFRTRSNSSVLAHTVLIRFHSQVAFARTELNLSLIKLLLKLEITVSQ